jgi:DNA-binding transcriptional regulator YiaG
MITTGKDLKRARKALMLSQPDLGRALRMKGSPNALMERVREMEEGRREISGPIATAVEAMLAGFMPEGFEQF